MLRLKNWDTTRARGHLSGSLLLIGARIGDRLTTVSTLDVECSRTLRRNSLSCSTGDGILLDPETIVLLSVIGSRGRLVVRLRIVAVAKARGDGTENCLGPLRFGSWNDA